MSHLCIVLVSSLPHRTHSRPCNGRAETTRDNTRIEYRRERHHGENVGEQVPPVLGSEEEARRCCFQIDRHRWRPDVREARHAERRMHRRFPRRAQRRRDPFGEHAGSADVRDLSNDVVGARPRVEPQPRRDRRALYHDVPEDRAVSATDATPALRQALRAAEPAWLGDSGGVSHTWRSWGRMRIV